MQYMFYMNDIAKH